MKGSTGASHDEVEVEAMHKTSGTEDAEVKFSFPTVSGSSRSLAVVTFVKGPVMAMVCLTVGSEAGLRLGPLTPVVSTDVQPFPLLRSSFPL